jgi:hypothetical protein
MANENQNTGPNLGGKGGTDPQALRQSLKQLLEDQGDFNNLLKNAISDLKRMDSSYAKIEARLSSLNKDSINVKQVNQELLRLRQKEFLEGKKLRDLEKEASDSAKNNLDNVKSVVEAQKQRLAAQGKSHDVEKAMMAILQSTGDLEAISLYTAEKQLEIAKQQTIEGQKELELEKQLNKQIGLSGAAFKLFSDKLGIGTEFYSQMVAKARQLQSEGKKITFFDKLAILGKAGAGGLKEAFTDPLTALPLIGTAIGGLVKGLMSVLNYILGIQDQTVKFARGMNLSVGEARKLKMEFASLSVSSGDLFINSQKMVESQLELTDALGVTNRFSNEQLATNIKLKDITGLDLETRKGILEVSTLTGKSSEGLTKSVLSQVAGLKQTTGISFQYQKILKEASTLGGYLGLSFAKYPTQLTKSLVTVKAMGMELKQLDSIADSFLDFESSISKEFEAQLLTGKDINLTKAREAFLNNDLATAAGEITKQVGSANDFLKLNRIQAESLASAFGMSRDQMGEMLKQQELLGKLGARDLKDAQAKVQALKAQGKTREEIVALTGEEAYQSLVNASAQEKIGAFMDKIKQSIADFVEKSGIIEKLEGFFDYLSKPENIKKVIEGVRDFFANAVEFIGKAAYYILEGLDYVAFGQIPNDFIDSIKEGAQNMGAQIRSLGGDFGAVTVNDNAAKNQNTKATTDYGAADANSMSMAKPKVYVMVSVDPITGKSVEKVVSEEYFEKHFGQLGK